MDSKTKHRILGVLVIIGIGVLVYPLLQSGNDVPSEQVLVKAPPFPDQASPLNQGPTPTVMPQPDNAPAAAAPVSATALPDSSASSENVTPDDTMRQQPDDVIQPSTSSTVVNVKAPDIASPSPTPDQPTATPSTDKPASNDGSATPPAAPAPSSSNDVKSASPSASLDNASDNTLEADVPAAEKPVKVSHQAARHLKAKTVAAAKAKLAKKSFASSVKAYTMPRQDDNNGLLKLNQVAWVIQVGSFKQKTAAMHLVNQLRENGYRAFIQQLPSSDGNNTQVFVGPENRQHLARALATQLQDDLKVKGIVISYQPFTL